MKLFILLSVNCWKKMNLVALELALAVSLRKAMATADKLN